jgi:hypothetical protein
MKKEALSTVALQMDRASWIHVVADRERPHADVVLTVAAATVVVAAWASSDDNPKRGRAVTQSVGKWQ